MTSNSCINFPITDIRKKADGTWDLLHITSESITVSQNPVDGYYIAYLKELPARANISNSNTAPSIAGFILSEDVTPSSTEFYVNYDTGLLIFHANNAGNTYIVDYYGRGNLLKASEMNYLYASTGTVCYDCFTSCLDSITCQIDANCSMLFDCSQNLKVNVLTINGSCMVSSLPNCIYIYGDLEIQSTLCNQTINTTTINVCRVVTYDHLNAPVHAGDSCNWGCLNGRMYYNCTDCTLRVFVGGAWKCVSFTA